MCLRAYDWNRFKQNLQQFYCMEIASQFSVLHRVDSFSQYHTPRYYQDTKKTLIKQASSFKKRQTYIADIEKLSKQIPGPNKYTINPEEDKKKQKFQPKIDFNKLQKESLNKGKFTFLDEQIKIRKKYPSVGKYNVEVDKTEEIRSKYKKKGDIDRKQALIFRPTIADNLNLDTVRIAPGSYEVQKPLGYKSQFGSINPPSKHLKSQSLPKLPSAFDYNPIPASYDTFSRKQSLASLNTSKKKLEIPKQKSKKLQTVGPGPKYSLIIDWAITKGKNGKSKGQNYLKNVHSIRSQSIYH